MWVLQLWGNSGPLPYAEDHSNNDAVSPRLGKNVSMRAAILTVALFPLTVCSATAATVQITVDEPSGVARKGWPVTSGVPLAEGALPEGAAVALYSADGGPVPLQTEVLARWPDGSARWLLLDYSDDGGRSGDGPSRGRGGVR